MKYDFTSIIDRQGQDAMAVDGLGMYPGMSPSKPKGGFDFIPMWVADMNFPTVPTIPEAIIDGGKTSGLRIILHLEISILMKLSNGIKNEMA